MDTPEKAVARGGRYRTAYLLAQARYISGLVKSDPEATKLAGPKLVAELDADLKLLEKLKTAWDEARFLSRKRALDEETVALKAAKWITGFRRFYDVALRRGAALPPIPPGPPATSQNSSRLAVEVSRLLELARDHESVLAPAGVTAEILSCGEEIGKALALADERQEVSRGGELRDHLRRLNAQKSRVHTHVKQVIAAGRSAHADEPSKARQYNLKILYRGPGQDQQQAPPAAAAV